MRPTQPSHRRARRGIATVAGITVAAITMAAAVIAGGCRYGPDPKLSYTELARRAHAQGQTPWFCHSEGRGGDMDEADGLSDPSYAAKQKGDLTKDQCRELAGTFDRALASAAKWPTRADAERDGWFLQVPFLPGLGTHEAHADHSRPVFDPDHPFYLQYENERDDAKLVGLTWFVQNGTTPPAGFPGDNDWFHTHLAACEGAVGLPGGISNEISDEVCAAHGGVNRHGDGMWMIHAWIVPGFENQYDVFAGSSACVTGGATPRPDAPCHTAPFTGTGHDHDPKQPSHTHGTFPVPTNPGPSSPTTLAPAHGHDVPAGHDH